MGFVSTRFAGSDGVSLESDKWARIFAESGHRSFWFAGKLDRSPEVSFPVPEAFFDHAANRGITEAVWGRHVRSRETSQAIRDLTQFLKERLYAFVDQFDLTILVSQNALTIPMHLPLGLALTEFIAETGMPTIAHHHDFYWERPRFLISSVRDLLDTAFPPSLAPIQHAVINSAAQDQLAWRKGIAAIVVPNVLHFERPPLEADAAVQAATREHLGLTAGDILILQPTRVVPRKGIEHAITLVSRLKDPRCKLVITHESGDEGDAYLAALQDMAAEAQVDLRFVSAAPELTSNNGGGENAPLGLGDVYACADLVTFPSLYEGFGNAFLEAFYFLKPIVVNRYSIWIEDIEPKGFQTLSMDGYVTHDLVRRVKALLDDPAALATMTRHNYQLAKRFFSYHVLKRRLRTLIAMVAGLD
jgi:glycosyltransferase involved in cell wall biosynthesis